MGGDVFNLPQLEEKQLFEKFWKGTFKAVATPRPESVIVASITARRRVTDGKLGVHAVFLLLICFRSPSHSLSPLRKKKKKKKKSSKKTAASFVCLQILSSKPGSEPSHDGGSQHLSGQVEGPHDYDSGNDTSSPPSSKTGVSRASVADSKRNHCQRLTSPDKLKFTDRDNASDSGNSVTSYASLCKPYGEDGLSITLGCRVEVVRSPKTSSCSQRRSESPRRRLKGRFSSSRSRSRSSGTSRYSGRYSRSPSPSSCRYVTVPRSQILLVHTCRRCLFLRLRDRKRAGSSRKSGLKHTHKVSGKRRRRKSYSPMRKRRRDSPSHLEARRITRYRSPSSGIYSHCVHFYA
uniref:Serine/arginine repetitive matrix 4 n=1 Tax=Salarias fasciatus TaxID=181472 RepID=A0A672I9U0_SALFA